MIEKGAFSIDNVNILVEGRFCQEIRYRIAHYDHFHSLKHPAVGYQVSHNCLVLTFVFDAKPANHDTGIICRLIEEEFHLCKHNLKRIRWSEKFAVDIKMEEVRLLFYNYYREIFW